MHEGSKYYVRHSWIAFFYPWNGGFVLSRIVISLEAKTMIFQNDDFCEMRNSS